jgi:putative lipoprotein
MTVLARTALAAIAAGLVACTAVTPAPEKAPSMKTLAGTLTYRQRIAIPPQTEAIVRLLDVSRADAPATVIAMQRFPTEGRQMPLPFALAYDPTRIDPRLSYAVSGELRVGERVLFLNTTRHSVLTRGAPVDNIELRLEQNPGR